MKNKTGEVCNDDVLTKNVVCPVDCIEEEQKDADDRALQECITECGIDGATNVTSVRDILRER